MFNRKLLDNIINIIIFFQFNCLNNILTYKEVDRQYIILLLFRSSLASSFSLRGAWGVTVQDIVGEAFVQEVIDIGFYVFI